MKIKFELNQAQTEALRQLGGLSIRGGRAATTDQAAKAVFVGFIADQISKMTTQRLMVGIVPSLGEENQVVTGVEASDSRKGDESAAKATRPANRAERRGG